MNNLIWKYKRGLDLYEEFPIMQTILFFPFVNHWKNGTENKSFTNVHWLGASWAKSLPVTSRNLPVWGGCFRLERGAGSRAAIVPARWGFSFLMLWICLLWSKCSVQGTKTCLSPCASTVHTVLLPNPHWTKSPKNAFFYAPRPFFKNSFLFSFRSGAGSVHSEALRWEGEHIRPNVYCSITSVTWSASLSQYRCKCKHCLSFPLFGSIAVFLYNDSEWEMFLWKGTSLSVDNQNISASFKYWYARKLYVVITFPHCCFMTESPISYAFSGKTHLTLPFQICLQFPGDVWFFLHPKHVFLPHRIPSLHSPFEP